MEEWLDELRLGFARGSLKDILELWALPVVRLLRAAEPFLAHRDELAGTHTWPELRAFAMDAENYLQRQGMDVKEVKARVAESPLLGQLTGEAERDESALGRIYGEGLPSGLVLGAQ